MARSKTKSKPLVSFNQSMQIDVYEPKFTPLDSVRFLDVTALANTARAEVAIGEIDGGCCHHTVHASIRDGKVMKVYADACSGEDEKRLAPDVVKLVKEAVKRARSKRRGGRTLPVPVPTFFGSGAIAQLISVETLRCVHICVLGFCITCCWRDDIPDSDLLCGRVTIDTTKPGLLSP